MITIKEKCEIKIGITDEYMMTMSYTYNGDEYVIGFDDQSERLMKRYLIELFKLPS